MGVSRRASTRLSMQHDDDDYDLEAMGISDGFRPAGVGMGHNRISSQTSHSGHLAARRTPPPRPPPRPSSITKPNYDSFALRHDGGMGDLRRNSTIASASNEVPLTRPSSVSSDVPYVRPESPYRGPAGPSHPYQMYPQESRLARTVSVATTSTAAPIGERSYAGPSGPTHPYGMYPQSTVSEGGSGSASNTVPPVPIGFPGLDNNYQRRLGPDGEEIADIIGPDGHTEQLPPYSQYPDEAFARKTRPNAVIPVEGAGGMGLATRDPEFSSQEDLSSPSRRSVLSDSSNHQINTAATVVAEKPPLKKWQQVAKRKLCGIVPVWVVVLVAAMFFLFAIILAIVFTALKPHHPKHNENPPLSTGVPQQVVSTTMTTTFDATPITKVPAGISSLPTGTYALPISVPSASQASCLINSAQSNAWGCSILPPPAPLEITVTPIVGAATQLTNNEVNFNFGNNTFPNAFAYGAQTPTLNQVQVLKLVTDSSDPQLGPAWFFQLPYNKLVILREEQLSGTPSTKRDLIERGGSGNWQTGSLSRKGVAQPGDKPWFCYWNGTLLEAFIYVNQTSAAGVQEEQMSSSMTTSTTQSAASTYSSSAPTSNVQSPGSSYSGQSQPNFLPGYPRVVKIEERRIPVGQQSISPYCVQHVINSDGSTSPFMNSTGQPVTIYLNETQSPTITKRDLWVQELIERDNQGECGCTWEWT